jgi:hypothetical protein
MASLCQSNAIKTLYPFGKKYLSITLQLFPLLSFI